MIYLAKDLLRQHLTLKHFRSLDYCISLNINKNIILEIIFEKVGAVLYLRTR